MADYNPKSAEWRQQNGYHDWRIIFDEPTGRAGRVFIGDIEISHTVQNVQISVPADDIIRVHMDIVPDAITVDWVHPFVEVGLVDGFCSLHHFYSIPGYVLTKMMDYIIVKRDGEYEARDFVVGRIGKGKKPLDAATALSENLQTYLDYLFRLWVEHEPMIAPEQVDFAKLREYVHHDAKSRTTLAPDSFDGDFHKSVMEWREKKLQKPGLIRTETSVIEPSEVEQQIAQGKNGLKSNRPPTLVRDGQMDA